MEYKEIPNKNLFLTLISLDNVYYTKRGQSLPTKLVFNMLSQDRVEHWNKRYDQLLEDHKDIKFFYEYNKFITVNDEL